MSAERVAVVTGGTRGLGRAVTEALLEQGSTVVAVYRDDTDAARELEARHGDALVVEQADLREPDVCIGLIARVLDRFGRIDYLVNNAGALHEARLQDVDPAQWEVSLALNLSAPFYLSQAALAPMRVRRFGRIVNVGSVSATMGSGFQVPYTAAKSGLVGLTRSFARIGARSSVTVNCLLLGGFETELLADLTFTDRSQIEASVPVGRFGQAEEFAHAVLSLLDDHASYITGAVLAVDGGLGMGE
jgi:acetoacetyl-CoA reductase/3-oxoacyl-[acyl-carrier protein] reductase